MPRALTEREKCAQCQRLLDKGRNIVFERGIKKISVDDITGAAGFAKGTFYQHFASKEAYLHALVWHIHQQFFAQAERLIAETADLRTGIRDFLIRLFALPEMVFLRNSDLDIIDGYADAVPELEGQSFRQLEKEGYRRLMTLAGINTQTVKPGVVHNYFHALYLVKSSGMMLKEDVQETFERMVDGLVLYIFGGAV